MSRPSDFVFFAAMALVTFAIYAAIAYAVAWLVGLSTRWCVVCAVGLPLALIGMAWIVEQISPMSKHDGGGGFIQLKFGWHHLWFAPGFVVMRWMR